MSSWLKDALSSALAEHRRLTLSIISSAYKEMKLDPVKYPDLITFSENPPEYLKKDYILVDSLSLFLIDGCNLLSLYNKSDLFRLLADIIELSSTYPPAIDSILKIRSQIELFSKLIGLGSLDDIPKTLRNKAEEMERSGGEETY